MKTFASVLSETVTLLGSHKKKNYTWAESHVSVIPTTREVEAGELPASPVNVVRLNIKINV